MSHDAEKRLAELGLSLPPAAQPVANYVPYLLTGSLLYISGQIARDAKGAVIAGRLSAEPGPGLLDIEHGQAAARAAALSLMAQVKGAIGDLNRIARVLRITGFVAATSDFTDHPMVMNGASDLLVAVFGDCGRHTRSAVGVASLPLGAAVEIDAIFEVAPPHA